MRLISLSTPAAFAFGAVLLTGAAVAHSQASSASNSMGGDVVERIVARVNDQIITQSDYDRALKEMDQEARQHGDTMQQMSVEHKDLLRSLIDQQLWLSKGKELGITGETELVKRLDDIRKQYNLSSLEDLEKAAREQGVSYEDFKQNIRNQIITQNVMRQEVGEHIQFTPGEAMRYYEEHQQDYTQPESVRLGEILIPADADDQAKLAEAKTKADDIEARLHAGGDFSQLARSFSGGPTASSGGDLGQYKRGQLPKLLEDKTFPLQTGQYTDPILTRQGYIILKVTQHTAGGPAPYKDVEQQVEEALYESRMEPAIREYLTKMREEAYIDIAPGYVDTGASPNETKPIYSAYVPPSPKKKRKVERTRFRESTHTFRQKGPVAPVDTEDEAASAPDTAATQAKAAPAKLTRQEKKAEKKKEKLAEEASEKPGKKEKIRFGQAPRETLPKAQKNTETENAGAVPEAESPAETADNSATPENPLEPTASTQKTRFSERAKESKKSKAKSKAASADSQAPPPPNAAEIADRATQSAPLGLNGDTSNKKKKSPNATPEKTRYAQEKKKEQDNTPPPQPTPIAPVPGAPAPAGAPQPQQQ
ncbi:MAG TPA: peptidylprolyl isomerase [Terracidiphilus sp.]|nr:peptidylprolyl isomerase [Terracidiphilus sp.]